MAKMMPLDPAPSTGLPVKGWKLVATEAGRYGDGLRATIQSHNGTLQDSYQLRLAHPKQWTACIEDVAKHSACDASAVGAAIRELIVAIEGTLRLRQRPSRDGAPAPVSDRPQIQVNARFDRDIIADAVEVLVRTNDPPTLFMRGSEFVRVVPGELQAVPFDVPRLRGLVDELADCVMIKASEYGDETVPSRLPFTVCQDFLVKPLAHAFPPLSGIRTAPVFLPDGRLLATEGYDRASGYLLRLRHLHGIRENMAVKEALGWLQKELLADFPLAGEYSRAHILALLLEPFVKPLIQSKTPVFAIDASTRGSGKGLLADVACLIATGGAAHVMALTGDSTEHEKKITALLMSGASWILMDNVTTLNSAALSAVLTASIWRGRILGASRMVSVPNDASWIATGNNIALSSEMARRVIPIRLEPQEERPEERDTFRHDPLLDWVRDHRAELVSACVSLIRAWIDAGRPSGQRTLGSFEHWASVMGGILGHAKVEGFLDGREALHADADHETGDWKALCEHWWEAHRGHPITAKDVLGLAKQHDLLLGLWAGRKEIAAQQRVGHALQGMRGRVFGEWCLRPAGRDSATKNRAYHLEPTCLPQTPKTPKRHDNIDDSQPKTPEQDTRDTPSAMGVSW